MTRRLLRALKAAARIAGALAAIILGASVALMLEEPGASVLTGVAALALLALILRAAARGDDRDGRDG